MQRKNRENFSGRLAMAQLSLRAKRGNLSGLLRRYAPRNDGQGSLNTLNLSLEGRGCNAEACPRQKDGGQVPLLLSMRIERVELHE
jgi:hypothetical protein